MVCPLCGALSVLFLEVLFGVFCCMSGVVSVVCCGVFAVCWLGSATGIYMSVPSPCPYATRCLALLTCPLRMLPSPAASLSSGPCSASCLFATAFAPFSAGLMPFCWGAYCRSRLATWRAFCPLLSSSIVTPTPANSATEAAAAMIRRPKMEALAGFTPITARRSTSSHDNCGAA